MDIIHAARTGNYMHGNGAQWYIINTFGKKVCIDTTTRDAFAVEVPNYTGTAYTCHVTANGLEQFLMVEASDSHHFELSYEQAKKHVAEAAVSGNLLYTNGGQWYVLNSANNVVIYELATKTWKNNYGYMANAQAMSLHGSWKYIKANNGARANITDDTKEFLGIR